MPVKVIALAVPVLLLLGTGACGADRDAETSIATDTLPAAEDPAVWQPGVTPQPLPDPPRMRIEVDLAARELHVFHGDEQVATHPVAVGSEEWPTPTGEWSIGQVVWNPRWIPPDEAWAEGEEVREPGDPANPLGRAQLVYDVPNSIHGTNAPESIGQAVSHGSIRVSNDVAQRLAREVMEAGGAQRDEAFYDRVRNNPTDRVDVAIPNPVPIRVR